MVSIGKFGNVFGNGDNNNRVQQTGNKTPEVKPTIDLNAQSKVEHKELGDDLLTSSFYPDVQFSTKVKNTRLGKLNDLEQMSDLSKYVDASKADRVDKKIAYNAIEGKDWSSWLTKAYAYGPLQTPEEESEVQTTKDYVLNNVDIMDSIVSFA